MAWLQQMKCKIPLQQAKKIALPKPSPDQQSLHLPGHTPMYPYLSSAKEDWLGFVAGFRFIGWLSQQLVPDFIPKRVPFY